MTLPLTDAQRISHQLVEEFLDRAMATTNLKAYRLNRHYFTPLDSGATVLASPCARGSPTLNSPRIFPAWWEEACDQLAEITEHNQCRAVAAQELQPIQRLEQRIMQSPDPIEVLWFLKLLSEFVFEGSKGIFFRGLARLRILLPELNRFFLDLKLSDDPDEGPELTEEAIQNIFQFFEGQYHYPPGLLSVEGVSSLPDLVEELLDAPEGTMRGWVVWNDRVSRNDDPHVTPVFVIKVCGKLHVFLFDSLGHEFAKERAKRRISPALETLIARFRDIPELVSRLAIYSYKSARQRSDYGCSIFSILDLKNLLERHSSGGETIVDFYAAQESFRWPRLAIHELERNTALPVFEIDLLPPEMMKVTESLARIDQYVQEPPTLRDSPVFERLSPSLETCYSKQDLSSLKASIVAISRFNAKNRARNLYMLQKRLSFIVYLLISHFKTSS